MFSAALANRARRKLCDEEIAKPASILVSPALGVDRSVGYLKLSDFLQAQKNCSCLLLIGPMTFFILLLKHAGIIWHVSNCVAGLSKRILSVPERIGWK